MPTLPTIPWGTVLPVSGFTGLFVALLVVSLIRKLIAFALTMLVIAFTGIVILMIVHPDLARSILRLFHVQA